VRAVTQVAVPATPSLDAIPMEERIVGAAVDLFATRGIDATSLQMIADTLGITKGAVYYHFKTKHEIVLAVCADSFDALEAAVAEAETIESVTSRERALDHLVPRLVAQAVESRSLFSKLRFDPVMVRLMADDARYEDLLARLDRLLGGDAPDADTRVRTAAAISALAGAPVHHLVAGLDDTALRAHLTTVLREIVR
jgi:AcrR family transcriptional regulator